MSVSAEISPNDMKQHMQIDRKWPTTLRLCDGLSKYTCLIDRCEHCELSLLITSFSNAPKVTTDSNGQQLTFSLERYPRISPLPQKHFGWFSKVKKIGQWSDSSAKILFKSHRRSTENDVDHFCGPLAYQWRHEWWSLDRTYVGVSTQDLCHYLENSKPLACCESLLPGPGSLDLAKFGYPARSNSSSFWTEIELLARRFKHYVDWILWLWVLYHSVGAPIAANSPLWILKDMKTAFADTSAHKRSKVQALMIQ